MAVGNIHQFESRDQLAQKLADCIRKNYRTADKPAVLAFSGGSTPALLFQQLSEIDDSIIMMVDDRWVDTDSSRSNEAFLKNNLGIRQTINTHQEFADRKAGTEKTTGDDGVNSLRSEPWLLPLHRLDYSVEQACESANSIVSDLNIAAPDICVLGMGTDGHTASWFPNGDNLHAATDPCCEKFYMPMIAPNAGEPRITMTLPPVAAAKHLILHIEGEEKWTVFQEAQKDGPADDMPVRHILRHPGAKLEIYWAP